MAAPAPADPPLAIVDSPLPVCRCRRFPGEAAYGKDTLTRQTCSGSRLHVRLAWPGLITRFALAPANSQELTLVPELGEQTTGFVVGDRTYWQPTLATELQQRGLVLLASDRGASRDPHPRHSAYLSRIHYRIETVFGQLVERCALKRVWARDSWHLWNRLLRGVRMHTLGVWLNAQEDRPPLHLAALVA